MFTICYETEAGTKRQETANPRVVELLGRNLVRRAETEEVWNIAVLDDAGDDCTFDFGCFQDPDCECPTCGAPAVGTTIPEHRPGSPCTVDYRTI